MKRKERARRKCKQTMSVVGKKIRRRIATVIGPRQPEEQPRTGRVASPSSPRCSWCIKSVSLFVFPGTFTRHPYCDFATVRTTTPPRLLCKTHNDYPRQQSGQRPGEEVSITSLRSGVATGVTTEWSHWSHLPCDRMRRLLEQLILFSRSLNSFIILLFSCMHLCTCTYGTYCGTSDNSDKPFMGK